MITIVSLLKDSLFLGDIESPFDLRRLDVTLKLIGLRFLEQINLWWKKTLICELVKKNAQINFIHGKKERDGGIWGPVLGPVFMSWRQQTTW